MHVGVQDSNIAEILAIEKTCQIFISNHQLEGRMLEVVSNSTTAVSWVKSEGFGSYNHVNQVYNIRCILKGLEGSQISFNPRSSNSFADTLAKMGSNISGDFIEWGDI
ncbi:hypothetical protein Q3G72_011041 [Acer saccharum]|nr:hypothetical protein Q3G72_011041 [Acer saccharum]